MKKLINAFGISTLFLLSGLSAKAQEIGLPFSSRENQKYYLGNSLIDLNADSVGEAVLVEYDKDLNGKPDTYAIFLVNKIDSSGYHTSDRAFAVYFDKNEDGKNDSYLIDTDLDGKLDKSGECKKEKGIII